MDSYLDQIGDRLDRALGRAAGDAVRDRIERKKPRLYLSGPMSGYADHNFPVFQAAALELRRRGHVVVSPHEIDHPGEPGSLPWTDYLRGDLAALLSCDAIVLLRGWPQSEGAQLELTTALKLKMPVYLYVGGDLLDVNREAR